MTRLTGVKMKMEEISNGVNKDKKKNRQSVNKEASPSLSRTGCMDTYGIQYKDRQDRQSTSKENSTRPSKTGLTGLGKIILERGILTI